MWKNPIFHILIFKWYLNGLFFEKKPKNTLKIPIWNIDQVKFDFLDDFLNFFPRFFGSYYLKNESDEGYSTLAYLVEKKSGYLTMALVLNFNDRFFQKKILKFTSDLRHWSEKFLIFSQKLFTLGLKMSKKARMEASILQDGGIYEGIRSF